MQKDSQAQGAIEYLLIIGTAILVVALVILAITGTLKSAGGTEAATQKDYNSKLGDLNGLIVKTSPVKPLIEKNFAAQQPNPNRIFTLFAAPAGPQTTAGPVFGGLIIL